MYTKVVKILITGGCGFIGSHLTDALLNLGHEVTIVDNLSTGTLVNLKHQSDNTNLKIVIDSILNFKKMDELIKENDYIFHLAAAVGVFNIVNYPLESLLTNIRGSENIFELALKSSIPVFLSSSSEVYGKNVSNSLRESDDRILGSPTTLRWSYSEAKAIDESLAYAYWVEKKLPTRIVRFFNTVGARQIGSYGMVLPRFVSSALKNEPIAIYGSGEQTRCFAHVLDVIDAIILVAFSDSTVGKVINIGNSYEISMNQLASKIIDITGSKSTIKHISYLEAYGDGFEDMERRVPNLEMIYALTKWKPKRDLDTIIKDVAEFLR